MWFSLTRYEPVIMSKMILLFVTLSNYSDQNSNSNQTRLMKGPSFCESMLAVPSLTNRPELAETGLAVLDVLGVLRAASMVLGRPV